MVNARKRDRRRTTRGQAAVRRRGRLTFAPTVGRTRRPGARKSAQTGEGPRGRRWPSERAWRDRLASSIEQPVSGWNSASSQCAAVRSAYRPRSNRDLRRQPACIRRSFSAQPGPGQVAPPRAQLALAWPPSTAAREQKTTTPCPVPVPRRLRQCPSHAPAPAPQFLPVSTVSRGTQSAGRSVSINPSLRP